MNDQQWREAWRLYQSGSTLAPEPLRELLQSANLDPEVRDAVLELLQQRTSGPSDLPDRKIGRYVLTERIGRGGMGEVFAARDPELNRLVAVKLLLPVAEGKVQPVERFLREAKAASALNHPNIVTVYEMIQEPSRLAIVMEFVEGTSLRRLCGAPLPADRVFDLGMQIANALAATHARGIVHSDIKPENVMLRNDGLVKVLDFGLARDLSGVSTGTMPAGFTLRYMSPERSRGEAPTAAGDIFALGSVLYELSAGVHPFERESVFATLQSLNEANPPPPSKWNSFVPAELDSLILSMLAKDASLRPPATEVASRLQSRAAAVSPAPGPAAEERKLRLPTWLSAAVAGLAILIASAAYFRSGAPVEIPGPVRFSFAPPFQSPVVNLAVSPDGTRIAFSELAGVSGLWIRSTGSLQAEKLPGTELALSLAWSPDGQSLAFIAFGEGLRTIRVGGGNPQTLTRSAVNYTGSAWGSQNVILYNPQPTGSGLWSIPATGGTPTPVTRLHASRQEVTHRYPQFLPDGKRFLYWAWSNLESATGVYVGSLDPNDRLPEGPLVRTWREARYADPGYLLYFEGATLMRRPFDPAKLEFRGVASPVPERIGLHPESTGRAIFSVAGSRALVYQEAFSMAPATLTLRDRTGKSLRSLEAPRGAQFPELSPDETAVILQAEDENTIEAVSTVDLARGVASRPWASHVSHQRPIWSSDGRRIAYYSNRAGAYDVYMRNFDGSGNEELLVKSPYAKAPEQFSSDGQFLLYVEAHPETKGDLWMLPMQGDRQPVPILKTEHDEFLARLSPIRDQQGRYWLSYGSDNSGVPHLYLRALAPTASGLPLGPEIRVSSRSAYGHRWRRDGRELIYTELKDGRLTMMAVDVKLGSPPEIGIPRKLFEVAPGTQPGFDISADARRFVFLERPGASHHASIHVALNWMAGLK